MSRKNIFLFIAGIFIPPLLLINSNIEVISFIDIKNIFYLNFVIIIICITISFIFYKIIKINLLNYLLFVLFSNLLIEKFILPSYITFNSFIVLNLLLTVLYLIIIKKVSFSEKFLNFLLTTCGVFLLYSIINFSLNQLDYKKKEEVFYNQTFEGLTLKKKPDIIHLIPDSLLSIDELAKAGYDTNKMQENFKSMNLKIIKNSYANYPKTHFSVSSFLNGSIFKENYEWKEEDVYKYLNNSSFHQKLIENGYQIEWYESKWLGSRCPQKKNVICANKNFIKNEFFITLFRSLNINYAWFEKLYFKIFNKPFARHLEVVLKNIQKFETNNPRYIYGYINIPHPPFSVDKNCNSTYLFFSNTKSKQEQFNKSQYLEQVSCFEKSLKKLYAAFDKRGKEFVIIIQSDTGYYVYGQDGYPSPNNDLDYPIEQFKPMFAVSENLKCFKDEKKIFNVEFLNLIISCLNDEVPKEIVNKDKLYSIYHHDHKKYGKIYNYSKSY